MRSSSYQPSLTDYIEVFRRRLMICVTVFSFVFGVSLLLAIGLPDVYRSSTKMQIDLEGPNVDSLEPLALTAYADQYVNSLQHRALTDDEIASWIEETDVYSWKRDDYSLPDLIWLVRDHIRIEMVETTVMEPDSGRPVDLITGFTAAFDAEEPQDAKIIAERLATTFLEKDREIRTERAAAASSFLRNEIDAKRQEIIRLEGKVAKFKETNAGSLPELIGLNMSVLERTERDIENVETDIRSLLQDKIFRESQLEGIRQGSKSVDRLKQLEEEYLQAIAVYGPDHPDVVRIRRQVAALTGGAIVSGESEEIQRLERELAEARQQYSDLHPDVVSLRRRLETLRSTVSAGSSDASINPMYLQLRAQVNAINSQLAGLRDRARMLKVKYDETQDRIARMPQVEREYLALNRDLQTEQLAFDDLRSSMAQAQQTESFESGEFGARLVKTRNASLPSEPAAPPRLAIGILGGILATMLALGAVTLAETLDGSVRSRGDILMLTNTPPIAEIPVIQISTSAIRSRRQTAIIGMLVLVIGAAVIVIWSSN